MQPTPEDKARHQKEIEEAETLGDRYWEHMEQLRVRRDLSQQQGVQAKSVIRSRPLLLPRLQSSKRRGR